ncbi:MAG: hypothetical protein RL456_2560 [Pseudomonadota bacterium]|jgi:hypothetical protein
MTDLHLDDQLKTAQIRKLEAEAEKLREEANGARRAIHTGNLSEGIKILAGIVIGLGGFFAARTQFEVAEMRASIAKEKIASAEAAMSRARDEASVAADLRDRAMREKAEADASVQQLRVTLADLDTRVRQAQPGIVAARLVYVQFQGGVSRAKIDEFRKRLAAAGYDAPGAERVAGDYRPMVKYFSSADAAIARKLAETAEKFLGDMSCPMKLLVVEATSAKAGSPLELWLPVQCRPQVAD